MKPTRAILTALSILACSAEPRPDRAGLEPTLARIDSVRLVDSIGSYNELDGPGILRRIEVHTVESVDTIAGVMTEFEPLIVGDSMVIGVRSDTADNVLGAFHYRASSGRVEVLPLPDDLMPGVTSFAFSPDGTHLAYVRYSAVGAEGIVRTWPGSEIVRTTPPIPVPGGDGPRGDARWRDGRQYEILIDPFTDGSARWVRFRGEIGSAGLAVDTVTAAARLEAR